MFISDHAHKQNEEDRKALKEYGYTITIEPDGWQILKDSTQVGHGFAQKLSSTEQKNRCSLDAAIHMAKRLHKDATTPPEPKPVPTPVPKEVKAEKKPVDIKARAVATAIGFLKQAGAKYTIEFGEELFTNIEVKPKYVKPDFRAHYAPLIAPLEGKTEGMLEITVPKEYDFRGYIIAIRNYVHSKFGQGRYITETDSGHRKISIMISAPEV